MPQFVLVLHRDPSILAKFSPEQMQTALEKYVAWTKKPFTVAATRLTPDVGKVMRNGGKNITDGPYSETKEVFGGLYVIEASDFNQAVERAKDHPHLEYGGTIEVRQVHQM